MRDNLAVEFIAEYNHILKLIGDWVLFRIAAVPNLRLAEEAESRTLDDLGRSLARIRAPEDPFERCPKAGTLCRLCAFRTFPTSPRLCESEWFGSVDALPA